MVGSTNDFESGYQPIIYKTTDSGDSWDLIELDFFTDEMQEFFEPYIVESSGGLMIPQFFETISAVDYHGDLQIFAAVGGHSADVTVYRDSLGYAWQYPGDLFNLTVDDNGVKEIIWIDSLLTQNMDDEDEGSYAGNGWNHRLSLAKNEFRNEFFLSWTDTRDVENFDINAKPDLFTWSRNVHTGDVSGTACLSEGTLYEGFYFFTYGAENAIYNAESNSYIVPHLAAVTPTEFSSNNAADPITFNYITGVEFPALGPYVSVNEIEREYSFEVSQNSPNPFSETSEIEIKSQKKEHIYVEITNLTGQTIRIDDLGIVNGSKKYTLSAENLESGIYFYTVKSANKSVSKKMIVY
jgi:hypothetical protein